MQKEVNGLFKSKNCILLHNAIDMNHFKKSDFDKKNIIESLDINKDAFIIGHVGRFNEVKNHKFLINVFKTVQEKRPHAHLILVDTGELENNIKNWLKSWACLTVLVF